jgi:hypothetical protein
MRHVDSQLVRHGGDLPRPGMCIPDVIAGPSSRLQGWTEVIQR